MQLISGVASHVRHSADLGRDMNSNARIDHVVTFRIGRRSVELALQRPPQIEDGDEVVIAGGVAGGTFAGVAYRNLDSGAYDRCQSSPAQALMWLAIGVVFLGVFPIAGLGVLPFALGWLVCVLPKHLRYKRALRQVRGWQPVPA
jgi:hypothetical protein